MQLSEGELTVIVQRKKYSGVSSGSSQERRDKGMGINSFEPQTPRGFLYVVTGKRKVVVSWFELVL